MSQPILKQDSARTKRGSSDKALPATGRVTVLPTRRATASTFAFAIRQLKRSVKARVGRVLLLFAPELRRRIEDCGVDRYLSHHRKTTLIERLVLEGLISLHTSLGKANAVVRSHHDYWAGDLAVAHHRGLQRRFASAFLGRHYPVIEALDRALATGRYEAFCEIGCGSGLVTDYVAKRWPSLRKVIGLDLSEEQVALNRKHYANPRLHFVAADASEWIPKNAEPGTVFFTYDGVLEYFPEETLLALLRALALRGPVCFAIVEPISADYDLDRETKSRLFGGEMTFSHNYPKLFAEAGFSIRWRQEIPAGRYLMMVVSVDADEPFNRNDQRFLSAGE